MHGYSIPGLIKKRIEKIRKNRSGASAIEIVIGIMIFLVVLCALFDLLVLSWRFAVISQTTSNVARTVGIQGGALTSAPHGFPGGNAAYMSAGELRNSVAETFLAAGIDNGEYRLTINGVNLGSGVAVDYRGHVSVVTSVDYEWKMLSHFIPGAVKNTITSKRVAMSEFKQRYDEWIGE